MHGAPPAPSARPDWEPERDAVAAVAPEATGRLAALDLNLRLQRLEVEAPQRERGLGLA